jgi:hypothetical protein
VGGHPTPTYLYVLLCQELHLLKPCWPSQQHLGKGEVCGGGQCCIASRILSPFLQPLRGRNPFSRTFRGTFPLPPRPPCPLLLLCLLPQPFEKAGVARAAQHARQGVGGEVGGVVCRRLDRCIEQSMHLMAPDRHLRLGGWASESGSRIK